MHLQLLKWWDQILYLKALKFLPSRTFLSSNCLDRIIYFFCHLLKFNQLNILDFSPCTNEDDGKIILTKIFFAKEILVGTTTYFINVMIIFYISNIPKIYK